MKQNMGEFALAVYRGQLQNADDTPEILNFSMKRRMFLTLLTVNLVMFLKRELSCCWYTAKQKSVR